MSEFQELIKNINKCRDYVRDFFVYGFKSRSDFSKKSARTYDDERRRIESWLSEYVHTDINPVDKSKSISLQIDSNLFDTNPLFRIWKVKSFTDNDIMLHFFIMDILSDMGTVSRRSFISADEVASYKGFLSADGSVACKGFLSADGSVACKGFLSADGSVACKGFLSADGSVACKGFLSADGSVACKDFLSTDGSAPHKDFLSFEGTDIDSKSVHSLSAADIADLISENYGVTFDTQIVRRKCNEYVEEGLLTTSKSGKVLLYQKSPSLDKLTGNLPSVLTAVCYYQLCMPFGYIGSTILDNQHTKNSIFRVKHDFPVFTLEDEILFQLISAIHEKKFISMEISGNKRNFLSDKKHGVPLKIFVSTKTGRRFLCFYVAEHKNSHLQYRFRCVRLDMIKTVTVIHTDKDISSCQLPKYYTANKIDNIVENFDFMLKKLESNLEYVWGVSFTSYKSNARREKIELTLDINEKAEEFILKRLEKEGKGGICQRIAPDTFFYKKIVFDANEMFPWLRTFIGRIIDIHFFTVNDSGEKLAENAALRSKFLNDIKALCGYYI